MKVRCEIDLDTESGKYSLKFWNMTSPGSDIEYNEVQEMLKAAVNGVVEDVESLGNEDERILKAIH